MQIHKKVLKNFPGCYAVNELHIKGKKMYIAATEEQGECCLFDDAGEEHGTVWHGPGGTMGIIPLPWKMEEFLAVQNFFPVFDSKHAVVVWGREDKLGGWDVKIILNLPYLHRFDILKVKGRCYFIACTLCSAKKNQDDWSSPGKVWAAELGSDLGMPLVPQEIVVNLSKNHGYWHIDDAGSPAALIASESGIYHIAPPKCKEEKFTVKKLSDMSAGDIACCDIDGDGEMEYLIIKPFHGNDAGIYKYRDGKFICIWNYKGDFQLGHVAWGGTLLGKPAFLLGCRKGLAALTAIFCDESSPSGFRTLCIDEGGGPANVHVSHDKGKEWILAANHTAEELVLYCLEE